MIFNRVPPPFVESKTSSSTRLRITVRPNPPWSSGSAVRAAALKPPPASVTVTSTVHGSTLYSPLKPPPAGGGNRFVTPRGAAQFEVVDVSGLKPRQSSHLAHHQP